ncbi:hypothetical protein QTI66_17380 [Variovorax sp. J22R133]|uniref:hypothetical protein n=1 Tax=Variovorax brevis TaxID=3053503 RepID=UPI0025770999|nr:hypothetical protein [Variovorax sp. J22R133]MDM0113931.1 hypothetical protein [Variovorax sp. J22R133]
MNKAIALLAFALAAIIFYFAWFTYEDEEKRIQSVVEDWWIRVDELGNQLRSRQTALLRFAAQGATHILDNVFGPNIWSLQGYFAAVKVIFWAGSLFGGVAIFAVAGLIPSPIWQAVAVLFAMGTLLGCGWVFWQVAHGAADRSSGAFFIFLILTVTVPLIRYCSGDQSKDAALEKFLMKASAFAVGGLISMLVFQLTRIVLVRTSSGKGEGWLLLFTAAVVGALASVTALSLERQTGQTWWILLFGMGFACLLLATLYSLLGAILIVMIAHRAAWPLISRALYILPRYKPLANKKFLNMAGVALMGAGFMQLGYGEGLFDYLRAMPMWRVEASMARQGTA